MLIWKRERVAFLHCMCHESAQRAASNLRERQTTHMKRFFIAHMAASLALNMQISLQKVIRAHSLNKCHFIWRVNKKHRIKRVQFLSRRMRFNIFLVCISFLGAACVFLCSTVTQ